MRGAPPGGMLRSTNARAVIVHRVFRVVLYLVLVLAALYFLLPLYVMVVNSFKNLAEIRQGRMLYTPLKFTIEPWVKAWKEAQIGVQATGLRPYFINSVLIVIPAVFFSVALGSLNGYVLAHWRFKHDTLVFGLMLFGCFIPFQTVLIPMARVLGALNLAGTTVGIVLVHVVYGIGFTTLFFRNAYRSFPTELVRAAEIDGAHFFRIFWDIILPNSGPVIVVSIIWQFTNVWNDFLFGVSFGDASTQPVTVALNNLVSSSTGVKEYNVHFAAAVISALPTLLVYFFSGKYFVRGLTAGSLKG